MDSDNIIFSGLSKRLIIANPEVIYLNGPLNYPFKIQSEGIYRFGLIYNC